MFRARVLTAAHDCHTLIAALVRADRLDLGDDLDTIVPRGVAQTSPTPGITVFSAPNPTTVNLLAAENESFRALLERWPSVIGAVQYTSSKSVRVLSDWGSTLELPGCVKWVSLDDCPALTPAGVTIAEAALLFPDGVPAEV